MKLQFITDPDDPNIIKDLSELFLLVDPININEESIERGLVKYTISLHDNNEKITNIVNKIKYVPVTVSLNLSKYDFSNSGPVIGKTLEVIKVLTEKILQIRISNVEYFRIKDMIVFTPITFEKEPVYENPKYLSNYYQSMTEIEGYQILSEDPLVGYVFNSLPNYQSEIIKFIEGVALIPVGTNDNEVEHYSEIVDTVETIIETRKLEGYFTYKISFYNPEDFLLIQELATLWLVDIISSDNNIIVLKTNTDFGTLPELWFRHNINLIKYGQLPTITLYGNFHNSNNINKDSKDSNGSWYKVKLLYASLLAYYKLSLEYEIIQVFTHTVKVNDDYSITIYIPSYSQVLLFKKYLMEVLSNGDWFVEPCKDLEDGFVKRYYVQTIDKKSMPMILPQAGTEILVFKSPASVNYPSPFDFNKVDLIKVKQDLLNLLDNTEITEWGIRGLFNIGPVIGLYSYIPRKTLIRIEKGSVLLSKLQENKYSVDIVFPDRISFLFDIVANNGSNDESELKVIIENLWSKGFFLSYWTSSYVSLTNCESFTTIITNPFLNDDLNNIKYLKEANNSL